MYFCVNIHTLLFVYKLVHCGTVFTYCDYYVKWELDLRESENNKKSPVEHLFSLRKAKLMFFDLCVLALAVGIVYGLQLGMSSKLAFSEIAIHFVIVSSSVLLCRAFGRIYAQVWRYSRTNSYLRLIFTDFCGGWLYVVLGYLIPVHTTPFLAKATVVMTSLLGAMFLRFMYTRIFELSGNNPYVKKFFEKKGLVSRICNNIVYFITGVSLSKDNITNKIPEANKIKIAVVGAGRIGAVLAEELIGNPNSVYTPVCFVDIDKFDKGSINKKYYLCFYGVPIIWWRKRIVKSNRRFEIQWARNFYVYSWKCICYLWNFLWNYDEYRFCADRKQLIQVSIFKNINGNYVLNNNIF